MLASDINNPNFVNPVDPDAVMIARFYTRAVKNNFKSAVEGRPVFEDTIYCEYYPAGSLLLKMDVPAQEAHKARFHKQWAYFQMTQGGDAREIGTPLSQWAILSPADVENLRALKFNTVENIAAASDQQLQALGMGIAGLAPYVLRARAQAYLASASDTALPQKQAEEIETMKREIAERDKTHAAEIATLKALIEASVRPVRRGRPPKKREHEPSKID